jgi:hypothetical protein
MKSTVTVDIDARQEMAAALFADPSKSSVSWRGAQSERRTVATSNRSSASSTLGAVYTPSRRDGITRWRFVSMLVTVTIAPGTEAPA